MELAIIILAALSILLILIAVILNRQVEQAQTLIAVQAREIESLRGKIHAQEIQLQLKRKPPKKQAMDPVTAKLKIINYVNEVLKDG